MENTSPEEMAAMMEKWGAWMGALQQNGQLTSGGSPLHYAGVRINADGVVTDIVSSEFKELVSGYSVIKAASADEALAIAKDCPVLLGDTGVVEIREVVDMGPS